MKKTLLLVPVIVLALTSCSAVMDMARSEYESHFDEVGDLLMSGALSAAETTWLPTDAVDITLRSSSSTDSPATAVIGFTSSSGLVGCTVTDRLSLPAYAVGWGPDDGTIVKTDEVTSCGDWVFIPTADGWFGWTPSAPGEKSGA